MKRTARLLLFGVAVSGALLAFATMLLDIWAGDRSWAIAHQVLVVAQLALAGYWWKCA
jgi:hypothetical protein